MLECCSFPGHRGLGQNLLAFEFGDDEQAEILGRAEILFFHLKGGGTCLADAVDAQRQDIERFSFVDSQVKGADRSLPGVGGGQNIVEIKGVPGPRIFLGLLRMQQFAERFLSPGVDAVGVDQFLAVGVACRLLLGPAKDTAGRGRIVAVFDLQVLARRENLVPVLALNDGPLQHGRLAFEKIDETLCFERILGRLRQSVDSRGNFFMLP